MRFTTLFLFCIGSIVVSFAGQGKKNKVTPAPATEAAQQPTTDLMRVRPNSKLDTIKVNSFTPLEMQQVIEHYKGGKELLIIDVNPPEDFAKGHMEGAINIPFDEFEKRVQSLRKEKERNIVIVCKDGKRSMTACGIMVANKFEWVWYLKKGLEGWVAFGKTLVQ
ncbi:MAG: rhodanese-like domain-containing protein [Candidatus Kapaibacterium sp.]|nr:rhodanese-like domain-containing protein [Bacteroidota bacterium]